MVSIIPLYLEKQQHLSVSSVNMHNCYSYSRLKTNIIRIFTWSNWFRLTYFVISGLCIFGFLWLPLINSDSIDSLDSFPGINGSSVAYAPYQRAHAKRCSVSLTSPVNNINSYVYMNILNVLMCMAIMVSFAFVNISYHDVYEKHLDNSYRSFTSYRNVLIYLAMACICNQLVSAFACRPMDILYSIRFTSIIIVQIVGFFVCLVFAFLLGIKYALLNHV